MFQVGRAPKPNTTTPSLFQKFIDTVYPDGGYDDDDDEGMGGAWWPLPWPRRLYDKNIILPSVSPIFSNNPGFTHFELGRGGKDIGNLKMRFLHLNSTFTNGEEDCPHKKYQFRLLDFKWEYLIWNMRSDYQMWYFYKRLTRDHAMTLNWMCKRAGYDPHNPAERAYALNELYVNSWGVLTPAPEYDPAVYYCLVRSINMDDFNACLGNPTLLEE